MLLPRLCDSEFNAPNERYDGTVGDGSDTDIVLKESKTFTRSGDEKRVNYV